MSSLYEDLAPIYEAMYQTFINYQEEYDFYSQLLRKHHKKQVLEVGSGTGNLAKYFIDHGFAYSGLDYSNQMIALARQKTATVDFIQGDMRNFTLHTPVESMIVTGRTLSYLVSNDDIRAAFSSFYNNLFPGGILCFDCIDASHFIPDIAGGKEVLHEASFEGTKYVRKSFWEPHLQEGMDFRWHSIYYKEQESGMLQIGEDHSIVRTFTVNEIVIFLQICGFIVHDIIPRDSYAFPTFVVVAEKRLPAQTQQDSPEKKTSNL
jgi:SAM-dependent methyltransferase